MSFCFPEEYVMLWGIEERICKNRKISATEMLTWIVDRVIQFRGRMGGISHFLIGPKFLGFNL